MQRAKISFFVLFAALSIGGYLFWRHIRTPEYLIKNAIIGIVDCVNRASGETNSTSAFKMIAFGTYLAPDINITLQEVPFEGSYSAEEFASEVARGRLFLDTLDIQLAESSVYLIDDSRARAEVTCRVYAKSKNHHREIREFYNLKIDAVVVDGKWRFAGFHEDPVIKK